MSNETWIRSCLGKKRYRTEVFAKSIASKCKHRVQLYVYVCPCCFGYHLTKQMTDL